MSFLNNTFVSISSCDITYYGKGNITEHNGDGIFGYASSRPCALDQITLSVSDISNASQTISFN